MEMKDECNDVCVDFTFHMKIKAQMYIFSIFEVKFQSNWISFMALKINYDIVDYNILNQKKWPYFVPYMKWITPMAKCEILWPKLETNIGKIVTIWNIIQKHCLKITYLTSFAVYTINA